MKPKDANYLNGPVDLSGFLTLSLKAAGLAWVGTMIGSLISVGSKMWDQPWMLWVAYLITFSISGVSLYLVVCACLRLSGRTLKH